MNMKHKISYLISVIILSLGFSSCEKGIDYVEYPSTIYFPQSGLNEVNLLWGESTYDLAVYRAGINQSNRSFEVSIAYDQAGGEDFIIDSTNYELTVKGETMLFKDYPQNMRYKLLPSDYYSLPAEKTSIGKDDERGFYTLHFNKVSEAFSGALYILPLKIESVTPHAEVLAEKNSVILHLADYRNVYGGPYRALGKVTSPSDNNELKIDTYYDAKSLGQNTVTIPGPINGMKVNLSINNSEVTVSGAEDSEHYNIKGVAGKNTYQGEFSEKYQRNRGDFNLVYTYETQKEIKQDDGTKVMQTWVYTVEATLKFWL